MVFLRLFLVLIILTACGVTTNRTVSSTAILKISKDNKEVLLIGDYSFPEVTLHSVHGGVLSAKAILSVKNGSLICTSEKSYTENSVTKLDLFINCNDGRIGEVAIALTRNEFTHLVSGFGVGSLNDNTTLKLVVGDIKVPVDF